MSDDGVTTLRTRSKVAPDWTIEESLILVNEVSAVESDCRDTLASFQKWKIIVENCNALGVNRNLNQCRRKWDSLLSDYKKIKQSGSKKASFNSELFKVIEWYVRDYEGGYDTDPDCDSDTVKDLDLDTEPVLATMIQSGMLFVMKILFVLFYVLICKLRVDYFRKSSKLVTFTFTNMGGHSSERRISFHVLS